MSKEFYSRTRQIYLASCLYDCIEDNNIKAIEKLLTTNGADPNIIIPGRGISPFHLAIGNNTNQTAELITKLLLNHGANPNVRSEDGLTPVHVAAAWGRLKVLEVLIQFGGDITLRDDDGKLPIQYATEQQHNEVTSYLKKINENLNARNRCNKKPVDYMLNKVIINNGILMAEYRVSSNDPNTLNYDLCSAIKPLPKTIVNSYVEEWCNKHADLLHEEDLIRINNFSTDVHLSDKSAKSLDNAEKNIKYNIQLYDSDSVQNNLCKYNERSDSEKCNLEKIYKYSPDKITPYLPQNESEKCKEDSVLCITSSQFSSGPNENYRESGIITINTSSSEANEEESLLNKCIIINSSSDSTHTSSDYVTCEEAKSTNELKRNVFGISENFQSNVNITEDMTNLLANTDLTNKHITNIPCQISAHVDSDNESFVSVAEEYKYIDNDKGIILIEKRMLVNPKIDVNKSTETASTRTSSKFSIASVMDYDTDSLRRELTLLGEPPGPLTKTTKRVYLRRLIKLQKQPPVNRPVNNNSDKVYSVELEKTFRNANWKDDLQSYQSLEDNIVKQFSNPEPTKRWREGVVKASFTYLLLDPRITNNLPGRAEKLTTEEMWKTFLSSIFYVGKGKRSRPYSHLYEAVTYWQNNDLKPKNKKIEYILNIWKQQYGVVCLHVFQNVIPVEAYTREAAMISAIKLQNLCNSKSGDFYGISATWSERQKRLLGVYLLHRAMLIFLNEGERQLRPDDIGK